LVEAADLDQLDAAGAVADRRGLAARLAGVALRLLLLLRPRRWGFVLRRLLIATSGEKEGGEDERERSERTHEDRLAE
jgi:hypothetical protein